MANRESDSRILFIFTSLAETSVSGWQSGQSASRVSRYELAASKKHRYMNEDDLKAELDAVYGSTSWRVTKPLRWVGGVLRRAAGLLTHPRASVRSAVSSAMRTPAVRQLAARALRPFPGLKARVRNLTIRHLEHVPSNAGILPATNEEALLTSRAREVLAELRRAKNYRI